IFKRRPIKEFRGHTSDILDLNWSKNNFLLSSSMDGTVRLWHVTRSECLCTFGMPDMVTGVSFHPKDDRYFISGGLDGKLRLWNIPAKKVQSSQEVPGLITAVAFTESGKVACVGTFTGAALFYDVSDKLTYSSSIAVRRRSS
ncbi:WD40 repeat-like protein, partial [Violaceomyces palustris]